MTIKVSQQKLNLTAEWIHDRLSDIQIYQYYVPGIAFHKPMKSPLRQDKREGSFGIYEYDNRVLWKDFATEDKGNVIQLVMKMFGVNYDKALQQIARDLGLVTADGQDARKPVQQLDKPEQVKQSSLIQVTEGRWTKRCTDYWLQFGVTLEMLKQEQVHPVKEWFLNRQKQDVGDELCFAYRYVVGQEQRFKIYYPERNKGSKWFSNISTKLVEGLEQLNGHKKVVICKSKKDRCVLRSLLPEEIGLISVQNESVAAYQEELVQLLSGRDVYISYDSDSPGKQASRRITERFGYRHVNVPDNYLPLKDWAEVFVEHGQQAIVDHFKNKQIL